jgi:hypothetical protein
MRFGDRDSEFEQLAVYSCSTPQGIVVTHHPDQITLWFLNRGGFPVRPDTASPNPKDPIGRHQLQPLRRRPTQHAESVPQGKVFQPQFDRGLKQGGQHARQRKQLLMGRPQEQITLDQPQSLQNFRKTELSEIFGGTGQETFTSCRTGSKGSRLSAPVTSFRSMNRGFRKNRLNRHLRFERPGRWKASPGESEKSSRQRWPRVEVGSPDP